MMIPRGVVSDKMLAKTYTVRGTVRHKQIRELSAPWRTVTTCSLVSLICFGAVFLGESPNGIYIVGCVVVVFSVTWYLVEHFGQICARRRTLSQNCDTQTSLRIKQTKCCKKNIQFEKGVFCFSIMVYNSTKQSKNHGALISFVV